SASRPTIRLWYPPATAAQPYRSIASTYLWGWTLVNEEMPHLDEKSLAWMVFRPATRLVFFLNTPSEAEAARGEMRRFPYDYQQVALERFGSGSRGFYVMLADLVQAGRE